MKQLPALDLEMLRSYPMPDAAPIERRLQALQQELNRKIVVLDDDPTGVQTVHDLPVYTDWEPETLQKAFAAPDRMFFILTNSRGFTREQTIAAHRAMAAAVAAGAQAAGVDFLLISRSDSTLRGHYPTETEVLREELERLCGKTFSGEVLLPFFQEGGRYTIGNVHYVREGQRLTPAGQTEFAKDMTFGYTASHLGEWVEEKTGGRYKKEQVLYIPLELLRAGDTEQVRALLLQATGFAKIVVNAIDYIDVKVFCIALLEAIAQGREYLFRSAAALTKVLGGVPDAPLLRRQDLILGHHNRGGIIIVGSHVRRTTEQLEWLRRCLYPIVFIEFNQHLVQQPGGLAREVQRAVALAEEQIAQGNTVAVYTRRERFDLETDDPKAQLAVSVQISDAVAQVIGRLTVRPSFIVAKGGITSSEIGTKALGVKKAMVMGQIAPGIPVWMTGTESKFPGLPLVIFPGNVGEAGTLCQIVETLMGE